MGAGMGVGPIPFTGYEPVPAPLLAAPHHLYFSIVNVKDLLAFAITKKPHGLKSLGLKL